MPVAAAIIGAGASLIGGGVGAAGQIGAGQAAKKDATLNALAVLMGAREDIADEKEALSRLSAENRAAAGAAGQGAAGSPIAVSLQNVFDSIKQQGRIRKAAQIEAFSGIQQAKNQARATKFQAGSTLLTSFGSALGTLQAGGVFKKGP